jgi:hypothetical protein
MFLGVLKCLEWVGSVLELFGVGRKCIRVVGDVGECLEVFVLCKPQSVSRDELGAV